MTATDQRDHGQGREPRRRRNQPSPADAQRLGDVHLVDRYDRTQLALLARLHRLDQAATPLVVPRGTDRVYRAEPPHRQRGPRSRLTLTAAEPLATRDGVITLLDLGLIHGNYIAPIDSPDDTDRRDTDRRGIDRRGERRTAHVLSLTRHGRDVLDTADRTGRLPR